MEGVKELTGEMKTKYHVLFFTTYYASLGIVVFFEHY